MHYLISLSFTYGPLGISVKGMVDFCGSPDSADDRVLLYVEI
jgi:hypothetical protein